MTLFDKHAQGYDAEFTHSWVGQMQRNRVWQLLPQVAGKEILEMNGGTGEDALFLLEQGALLTLTDISEEMLKISRKKIGRNFPNIRIQKWDLCAPMDSSLHKKYALFFSNFGGWNCLTIEEIQNLAQEIHCHMEEEGRLIVVIMGRKCLWETLYFICKGNFSAAFRRRKKSPSLAQVEGVQVPTYYYSPSEIRAALLPYFAFSRQFPIGFAVPPSYLNPFWNRFPILKRISAFLEKRIQHWAFLSDFSDHYYLEMCRVNT